MVVYVRELVEARSDLEKLIKQATYTKAVLDGMTGAGDALAKAQLGQLALATLTCGWGQTRCLEVNGEVLESLYGRLGARIEELGGATLYPDD